MTVLLAAIGATGWLVATAMVWRSDGFMMRMIQEVNAKSDPKAKIPLFYLILAGLGCPGTATPALPG